MTYTIELPDGTAIGPGQELPALGLAKYTAAAFSGTEADPGGVCAGELEAEFLGDVSLNAGDVLKLYRDGVLLGTFTAEKPTVPGPGRQRVLAYDAAARLDRDLTDWLEAFSQWPCTLEDFAWQVCAACGLELQGSLENAQWPIPKFQARGITGRQLMQWVCQAGCRFCRADPEGVLTLDWVADSGVTLAPTGDAFYFAGMTRADYTAAPADHVQIALTDSDVGVQSGPGENLLSIRGNYLLCGCGPAQAQAIAAQLPPAYTPCVLETTVPVAPGRLLTVAAGEEKFTVLAMTVEEQAGRFRVTATGSPSRESSTAVCRSDYRAMSGRVMALSLDLQGLRTRLSQQDGELEKYSALTQDVDSVTARVGRLESDTDTRFTQLELQSEGMSLSVGQLAQALEGKADTETVAPVTEHFRFDADGLTISDSATGMSILVSQEAVAFREGTVITPEQLQTTRLQIGSRLDLGGFSLLPRSTGNLSLRYTGG